MKLTKNEIKYLSASFVPQTPISIFANIEAQPDATEYQSLVSKGVIVGNAYSPEALEMLTLLAKPDRGARFFAQTPDFLMEKYTYRIGDTLILAENNDGVLEFTKVEDVTSLASRFVEAFGMSAYGSSDIDAVLTPGEMTVIFAFTDLLRKNQLVQYAGMAAGASAFSVDQVAAEIAGDYKNGLTGLFLKNYRLTAPSAGEIAGIVASLTAKGVIAQTAGYTLTGQYEMFARKFLVIETIAMYEAFGMLPGGEVATIARLAACAGKNEVMAVFYDGDLVQFNATSPLQLLINIEAFMSCPAFERPPEPPKPVAPPAPAPAPAVAPPPVAPPAPAPVTPPPMAAAPVPPYAAPSAPAAMPAASTDWTCSCGRSNNGNFCAACGSRKP
jgi:hypothetical protein